MRNVVSIIVVCTSVAIPICLGCSSPTEPLTSVSRESSNPSATSAIVTSPTSGFAWDTADNVQPAQQVPPLPVTSSPTMSSPTTPTSDDALDLSDLNGIAPATVPSTAFVSEQNTAAKPGLFNSPNAATARTPAIQLASRSTSDLSSRSLNGRSLRGSEDVEDLPTTVELREAGSRDLRQIIESFSGNVVFVDFWASWCGPCVGAFPHTVRMHELAYQNDLRVITVSLDKPDKKESVLRFLKSRNATCVNLLATSSDISSPSLDFGIPGGAIPHFKLYDRSGTKRYDWTGGGAETAKDVRTRVVELLREP